MQASIGVKFHNMTNVRMRGRFCPRWFARENRPRNSRSILGLALLCAFLLAQAMNVPQARAVDTDNPIPIMAYYYIWFNQQSWDRAKTDFPILGRYSSDDPAVMQQHIQWAKNAGISGFIVSWKNTQVLDRRLQQLVNLAQKANFKLWIIYEGLDFSRKPLPVEQVSDDIGYFVQTYAKSPVFATYDRPVVILSGTWEYTPAQIQTISSPYRSQIYFLASEHNVAGYLRLADSVDGNAYYWSSVDPGTYPDYEGKLNGMGQAVHAHDGLWIAPAAPGFDARLIGGTNVVERDNGQTLRTELDAALNSNADAVGLISWNEFSENSYIEPSQKYGTQALDILADRATTEPPKIPDFDSSEQGSVDLGRYYTLFILGIVFAFVLVSVLFVIFRHRRQQR